LNDNQAVVLVRVNSAIVCHFPPGSRIPFHPLSIVTLGQYQITLLGDRDTRSRSLTHGRYVKVERAESKPRLRDRESNVYDPTTLLLRSYCVHHSAYPVVSCAVQIGNSEIRPAALYASEVGANAV